MTYEYKLCEKHKKEFGFTHLLCDGWFGIYAEKFNKKYDEHNNQYIERSLTDKDIDRITKYTVDIREY